MARGFFRLLLVVAALACADAFSVSPMSTLSRQLTAASSAMPQRAAIATGRARHLRQRAAIVGAAGLHANAEWKAVRVKVDGKTAIYEEKEDGAEVGIIQSNKPLTSKRPYFEIKIEDGGSQNFVGIGLATQEYPDNKQPGWDLTSVGYHADDGSYYRCPVPDEMSKSGRPNNMPLNGKPMPCEKGDVMGVGLEFDDRGPEPTGFPRRVYFTKNQQYLGSVLLEKQFHPCLYPTIGMNSPGAKITLDMECAFDSVKLAHTAQFFGTNDYATDITLEAIANGAEVNIKDIAGRSPLHMAAAYGATPVARQLIDKGADPDLQVHIHIHIHAYA